MKTAPILLLSLYAGLSPVLAVNVRDDFDAQNYPSGDVITRDVAVIGGGATGTYGAVKLRDAGKSVVLVEKEGLLGGHVNSYTDPSTGVSIDYGVQAFWNISVTRDYFALLNLTTGLYQPTPLTRFYADFQTGAPVEGVRSSFNFSAYAAQLEKYPQLLYSWDLPSPIPEDLLLPFGAFIQKYNLGDEAFDVYFSAQGVSNILDELTVHVFKFIDESFLSSVSGNAIVPTPNNAEIYAKASAYLGDDVLLSSTVVAAKRPANSSSSSSSGGGIRLIVQTPTGKKLIKASKLLISIPPLLSNTAPFDLSPTEQTLFSHWRSTDYYTMLLRNTGLPAGAQFANANASTATYNIPLLPAAYQITETRIPGLFYAWYGSPVRVTEDEVKEDVSSVIARLQNATTTAALEFVEFRSHTPFKLVVDAGAIGDGFYGELEAIQGQRDTWWTGAAFMSHDASVLYNFTQALLPGIIG